MPPIRHEHLLLVGHVQKARERSGRGGAAGFVRHFLGHTGHRLRAVAGHRFAGLVQSIGVMADSVARLDEFGRAVLAYKSALVQKAGEGSQRTRLVQPAPVTTHGAHVGRILEGRAAPFEGVAKAIGSHDRVGFKLEC